MPCRSEPLTDGTGIGRAITFSGIAQIDIRSLEWVRCRFILTMEAKNLARLPKRLAARPRKAAKCIHFAGTWNPTPNSLSCPKGTRFRSNNWFRKPVDGNFRLPEALNRSKLEITRQPQRNSLYPLLRTWTLGQQLCRKSGFLGRAPQRAIVCARYGSASSRPM